MIGLSEKLGVDVENARNQHVKELLKDVPKRIGDLPEASEIRCHLLQDGLLETILGGEPEQLLKEHEKLKGNFENEVKAIFSYDLFTRRKTGYTPQTLAENLGIQTCPYCNAQYTKTIKGKSKNYRPTFDHVYPKKKYPLLALSFFNLVPSCWICNHGKGENEIDYNPYLHDIQDACRFTWHPQTTAGLQGLSEKFDLKIVPLKDHSEADRAKNCVEFFHLETLYKAYKDHAAEVIQRKLAYPDSYLEQIQKLFNNKGGFSKSEVYRLAFGNYIEDKDLLKRPLSKMIRDLLK